jgi:hypothetical protein
MFSPLKTALFALLSFATLALAVPTSQGEQPQDVKACIVNTNFALEQTVLPLSQCYLPLLHFAHVSSLLS